jgi:hypothetical protein
MRKALLQALWHEVKYNKDPAVIERGLSSNRNRLRQPVLDAKKNSRYGVLL